MECSGPLPELSAFFAKFKSIRDVFRYFDQGISDTNPGFRFLCYQIMLKILPLDSKLWENKWEEFWTTYTAIMRKFTGEADTWAQPSESPASDTNIDSTLVFRLNVDLRRSQHHFKYIDTEEGYDLHYRRMQRMLYLFAKFNASYGYVQGFHELMFPLYYVTLIGTRSLELEERFVEPITFFLFQALIVGTEFGEFFFVSPPDKVQKRFFSTMLKALRYLDTQFYHLLTKNQFAPLIFAFPWATVLFSQMYAMPRLLHLWDFLLSRGEHIMSTLVCLLLAHILKVKEEIREMTYKAVLELVHEWFPANEADQIAKCRKIMSILRIRGDFTA